jgi:hypothetical protein
MKKFAGENLQEVLRSAHLILVSAALQRRRTCSVLSAALAAVVMQLEQE